jgi:hypothetical protein
MHLMRSIVLVPVLAFAAATTVFAQTGAQGREAVPDDYGYLIGHGGVTAAPAGAEFAVEYGEHITRNVQAYVTLSYFENLMNDTLRDDLTTLGASLAILTGKPWALDARDRGVSLVGGGKYLFGNGNIRPYVGGGAGIISLRRTVIEARLGDIRNAVFNDFEVGDGDLSLAAASITQPLVEAAFGVGIARGNAFFDIGYRYRRVFRLASTLDFSQIGVGVGYKF